MDCVGYHGTHNDNVRSIINNGYYYSNENEWFGKGIYFFESQHPLTNGFIEARDWAIYVKNYKKWVVFKAKIESDKYHVLDINHKKLYDDVKSKLLELHKKSGKDIKIFDERIIFKKLQENVDFIRAIVDSEKKLYISYLVRRIQIQICVKNADCVKKNVLYKSGEIK